MQYTIRQARQRVGLTQLDMATRLGLSRYTYMHLEQNPENITVRQANSISRCTGIPVSDLLFSATPATEQKQVYKQEEIVMPGLPDKPGTSESSVFGYARVSTKSQKTDRQIDALLEAGIPMKHIYQDKQSGKDFDRPAYKELVRRLRAGDTLFVLSIDRLGRNYYDIQEQWSYLTHERGVFIVVLDMPLLDTRTKMGDLTGTFIADIVLKILCYVAETERRNNLERQAEGIAAAKARGKKWGNPGKPIPEGFEEVVQRYKAKEISIKDAINTFGISESYFFKKKKGVVSK